MTDTDIDSPWWPFEGPIPKKEMFPSVGINWAIEDFLTQNKVFLSRRNERCHCDSYGTVVDFVNLESALNLLDETYRPTPDDWALIMEYWNSDNMQPPLRIVRMTVEERLKQKQNQPAA